MNLTVLECILIAYGIIVTIAFTLSIMIQRELHKEIKRLKTK